MIAELIDGELFVKMESPTEEHQDILMDLSFQIEAYIQRKKGIQRGIIQAESSVEGQFL